MAASLDIEVAGTKLRLLAGRGAHWPDQRILFVADTHLGKEATFRRHNIPVPRGSSTSTLAAIGRMLAETEASQLVILGDMFHARSSLSLDVCKSLDEFFAQHRGVRFSLVPGNHDAHVGKLPGTWPIETIPPHHQVAGVALAHHPDVVPDDARLLLCGHLHPAVRVASKTDSLGKLPCFWLSKRCLVLPAIGRFTGTHTIRPRGRDRIWLIADNQLIEQHLKRSHSAAT